MTCSKCLYKNIEQATFCGSCGSNLVQQKEGDFMKPVKNIIVFFLAMLVYILMLNIGEFESDYLTALLTDVVFAGIIMLFFFRKYEHNKRLINFNRYDKNTFNKILFILPAAAVVVFFLAGFLNENVFDYYDTIYYDQFRYSPSPLLFCVISIGVFPAIFEEIAFRGILFDQSLKIMGLKTTIIFTAALFTLMHLSVISFLWIFPLGLIFGYLRAKFNTLVYGMLGHFLYNTTIVVIEIMLND